MFKSKYRLLGLLFLLGLSLACQTVTQAFLPATEIIISPKESTGWDADALEQARQIIATRLNASLQGRYEVKIIRNDQISVSLYEAEDVEMAKRLATEVGAVIFVDSADPYPVGYTFDDQSNVIMTQRDIQATNVSQDQLEKYQISFTLTASGTQKMFEYTANNVGRYLLIVRDGIVVSSPMVQGAIPGGQGVITGDFTQQEATELASILSSPSLPFPLVVTEVKFP